MIRPWKVSGSWVGSSPHLLPRQSLGRGAAGCVVGLAGLCHILELSELLHGAEVATLSMRL